MFVRRESEHTGSLSGLLRDQTEVDHAIVRLLLGGAEVADILVVEFCDTAQDRLFRKYAAFRVGDHIIPRHIVFSSKWVLKGADLLDAAKLREEREYLESNPHEQELREIFECAQIDYGRVDYGLLDGRVQVWEINSNPGVMLPPDKYQAGTAAEPGDLRRAHPAGVRGRGLNRSCAADDPDRSHASARAGIRST